MPLSIEETSVLCLCISFPAPVSKPFMLSLPMVAPFSPLFSASFFFSSAVNLEVSPCHPRIPTSLPLLWSSSIQPGSVTVLWLLNSTGLSWAISFSPPRLFPRAGDTTMVVLKVSLLLLLHGHCPLFPLAHSATGKRPPSRVSRTDRDLPEAPPQSLHPQHATGDDTFLLLLLPLLGGWGMGNTWQTSGPHCTEEPRSKSVFDVLC